MKKMIPHRIALLHISVLAILLVAASGMFAFSSETSGFAPRHQDQDPPPSPAYASADPYSLEFGNQVVRRTSAPKRITVRNTGGKPLYFESVAIGGDNPNSFAIMKDTCTGATIGPDRACIVDVTFTPTATGGRNARVRLNCDALNCPQRVPLKGNGINSNDVPPF